MATHLLTGDDEALLRAGVQDLVDELVGDGDRSIMVDDYDGDEYEMRSVVDAAQTPPFLTDKRVVVARGVGRFTAEELTPLLAFLDSPLDTTDLVLSGGGGRLAKKLTDAVKAGGSVLDTSAPARPKDRERWVSERVARAGIVLDRGAAHRLAERLGEDAGRLDAVVDVLIATYGPGASVTFDDVDPFVGDAGGVPPWDLTDAVDRGDTTAALTVLERMTHAGGRHPLQIMSILHNHYAGLARLDGAGARTEQDVMSLTGIKSAYPAKKALANYRRLGGDSVRRAIELLAQADLDLRGARDLGPDLVMQVLVARLSKLG